MLVLVEPVLLEKVVNIFVFGNVATQRTTRKSP